MVWMLNMMTMATYGYQKPSKIMTNIKHNSRKTPKTIKNHPNPQNHLNSLEVSVLLKHLKLPHSLNRRVRPLGCRRSSRGCAATGTATPQGRAMGDSDSDLELERPGKGSRAKESKPKVKVKDGTIQGISMVKSMGLWLHNGFLDVFRMVNSGMITWDRSSAKKQQETCDGCWTGCWTKCIQMASSFTIHHMDIHGTHGIVKYQPLYCPWLKQDCICKAWLRVRFQRRDAPLRAKL